MAITVLDLIQNGTISPEMAATFWAMVEERKSFLVVAIPRLAGKTTTGNAILGMLPPDVPVHRLTGDESEMLLLQQRPDGGYIAVAEVSLGPVPGYIWGRPVRTAFETARAGYAFTASLHAADPEETFAILHRDNGVPDEDLSRLDFMVYIQRFGTRMDNLWRRVDKVFEIGSVVNGRPETRVLHSWRPDTDTFSAVQPPQSLAATPADLARRAAYLQDLIRAGRTSPQHLAHALASFER